MCMESLLNGLKAMQTRTATTNDPPPQPSSDGNSAGGGVGSGVSHPLWQRKLRKRQLKAGAVLFNDKARSGLQALQRGQSVTKSFITIINQPFSQSDRQTDTLSRAFHALISHLKSMHA